MRLLESTTGGLHLALNAAQADSRTTTKSEKYERTRSKLF